MEYDEEKEKYILFEKDISKEDEFIKKIKDIIKLQYFEKLQDILILQKNQFLSQIEQEVIFILKKLYSSQITSNQKFNSLFKSSFQEFESKYNSEFREIHSKFDFFLRLKSKSIKTNNPTDIEALNIYYIANFRKHCMNHTGPALHKCGHAEKGKFIKINLNMNKGNLFNESAYVICEECKKVFSKDLFNNFCSSCKENYLCSILPLKENKDCFLISYSNPHCDTFINRTIPCKLCKEKLYVFISEKKIKCIKCNYVLDIEGKNEFNWQCPKCNKNFKSNIKFYNPCENFILTKILKKALLLKIKAKPQFMNCCDINVISTPFYHKRECKGLLYLCNLENYFLKNKKWAIVCEKCQAINNCKNFIWTCPKCGRRTRETDFFDSNNNSNNKEKEFKYESPQIRDVNEKNDVKITNDINNENIDNENNKNDDNNNIKKDLNKKYLSDHKLKQCYSQLLIKENPQNNNKEKESNIRISVNERKNDLALISRINNLNKVDNKDNMKLNYEKENSNDTNKCYIIHRRRNYQVNTMNNINNFRNKEEKNKNLLNNNEKEEKEKNNCNENKSYIPAPRSRYAIRINNLKNNNINNNINEIEKNNEKKVIRCESYKSSLLKENKEPNQINEVKSYEKNNSAFKINNRKNIPVRLKYSKNNNINYNNNNNNKKVKDPLEEINNNNINNNNLLEKKEEEFNIKKNLIFSRDEVLSNSKKNSNETEYKSKETTSQCSKGSSVNSLSNNNNNTSSKYNYNLKQTDIKLTNDSNKEKEKDNLKERISVSPNYNYNFKNKRKYYIQEKEKRPSNNNIIVNNEKYNSKEAPNKNIISLNNPSPCKYKSKNYATPSHKFSYIENQSQKLFSPKNYHNLINNNDKPDDVIEPEDVDFSQDIQVNDPKIKQNKNLFNEIQTGIKKILEKGKLPQFNIDNYTIEKKIGDGAFGVLFSVINNKTKKKYALKKLTATDLSSLEEFQKEFEIAYKNNHDNILNLYGICVRVYDVTTYVLFVLMDLAEHDWEIEINNRFKEKRFYSEIELINILKQLSNACVYLQKKEIAHRDIKPENILLFFEKKEDLTSPALYKICDFGEAKEKIKVGSRHKSIRGTDYYMSPILFKALMEKEKYVRDDPFKSDVFSLGYCMIIAAVLDFNFIDKIRKVEEQRQIDRIIREALEERYSFEFIYVILRMIVHNEKERIDFLGLEKLIKDKLG